MPTSEVRFRVNGEAAGVTADPQTPLVLALRNDLGLRGVRTGCSIGSCGVCTILVGGVPTKACSTPLGEIEGRELTTPEGLGTPEAPDPVQQAFLDEQAGQCGYCINGMIMTVAALQARRVGSEQQLRAALDEHLCRCATHMRILRAGRRVLGLPDDAGPATELAPAAASEADTPVEIPGAGALPVALEAYPNVEDWLSLREDGRVEVHTGKVEIGQGIRSAMAQIAAAQLGVDVDQVVVLPAGTADAPDEGFTSGSNSVDGGGAAVGVAARALRRLILERAAAKLGRDVADLTVDPSGAVRGPDGDHMTFAELAAGPVRGRVTASDRPDWAHPTLGEPWHREDLVAKLTGAPAYVHDLALDGMLHARVLLPPTYNASLREADVDGVAAMPGVVRVVADGRLLLVVAEREDQVVRALSRLTQRTRWDDPGLRLLGDAPDSFRTLDTRAYVARDEPLRVSEDGRRLTATYRQPYQAHAAIAPSCAVALTEGGRTRIWSHTQGVHPLRRELAAILNEDPARLEIVHMDGPGCYGQNLADDAAAFAAVAARAVEGAPVRFQFTVEDEFAWDPFGPALLADLEATLTPDGRIASWRHRALTDVHSTRPRGGGHSLILPWLQADGVGPRWPGPTEGGARNAVPVYDLPAVDARADHVDGPLRVGALRSLGAFLNVFAAESFMDELAELAHADPLEFRLAHLLDARARRVLLAAAEAISWNPHVGPSGRGVGLAVARYKSVKAYVAQAVEVAVDQADGTIEVRRVVTVCDAGTVINRDGLVNQLEGGTLQGLSRTLYEQVAVTDRGVQSRDWTSYPVLRFANVPRVETVVLSSPGAPPLGAGEAATPPVAAAVANATDDAVGIRLRDLPLTPKRMEQRLLAMDEEEARRVRLM